MAEKILITGATGFIGSHLAELCVESGYEVRAFDRYNPNNHWGWLEHSEYKDAMEVVLGDIRDYDSVSRALEGCDAVFHLAALIGIPYSYVSPLAYIRTNVEGTYNVLEAARNRSCSSVLVTSTSETYGSAQYTPMDESHPVVGQSPYSASKIGADQIAVSYYRSFDLPVKIVRPFNAYGPRQSDRAIIPTIISQVLSGKSELSLGNLAPTRDLTYVRDTAAGFLAIHNATGFHGEVTNIGSRDEISIGDLAELICELMDTQISVKESGERVRPGKSEVDRLICENAKLMKHTDWNPATSLRQGLSETISWIREHQNYFKVHTYSV